MFTRDQLMLFDALGQLGKSTGVPLFVVGGVLRDVFLGEEVLGRDIDFVMEGNALEYADHFAANLVAEVKKFPDFLTVKLLKPQRLRGQSEIDLASARAESYRKPGALPTVSLAGIKQDLDRRDFSINAMAIRLEDLLAWIDQGDGKLDTLYSFVVDPHRGRSDLQKAIVRVLHESSFKDDPTRIFRASRYVTRIGGKLDSSTDKLLQQAISSGALETISNDRKFNEIKRIFKETRPERALRFLLKAGVFGQFDLFPAESAEEVFLVIKRIGDLNTKRNQDFMYGVALRVFHYFSALKRGEDYFKKFGFGRKQIRQFSLDLEQSRNFSDISSLTAEALVLSLIWDDNRLYHDDLAREGRRRGLIVCAI